MLSAISCFLFVKLGSSQTMLSTCSIISGVEFFWSSSSGSLMLIRTNLNYKTNRCTVGNGRAVFFNTLTVFVGISVANKFSKKKYHCTILSCFHTHTHRIRMAFSKLRNWQIEKNS